MGKRKRKGTVILCDDEAIIRKVGKKMLEACGYEAITATSGRELFSLLREELPPELCAIIIDIQMPDRNGFQILDEIRTLHPELALIASSGFPREDYRQEMETADIDAYLFKPYSLQKIEHTVDEAVKRYREREGL